MPITPMQPAAMLAPRVCPCLSPRTRDVRAFMRHARKSEIRKPMNSALLPSPLPPLRRHTPPPANVFSSSCRQRYMPRHPRACLFAAPRQRRVLSDDTRHEPAVASQRLHQPPAAAAAALLATHDTGRISNNVEYRRNSWPIEY